MNTASDALLRNYLRQKLGKQVTLINRIGDENRVRLVAVSDHSCTVKYAWGTTVEVYYKDDNYDIK